MAHDATPSPDARTRARDRIEASMDEQKRSFLRMVSHELRTPLNSILGFSEILSAELYGPLGARQYKEYAEIIHGSGQKLLKLVNQVLEIARLEGRTVDFDLRSESLDSALDDVTAQLAADVAARGITLVVEARGDLPSVVADARGLRSVLFQLLHNAVAFSPDGGEVRISATPAGDCVDIRIVDQGEGIDPDELHRLMAPFEQGDNALVRRAEGAGLGLPIADLTCRAMSGRLRLAPAEHGGLLAHVQLPPAA